MTVRFRNVDAKPGDPVETWPYEAIVTAIERGTISDWLPLTGAIRSDPWGPVSRQVEDYLSYEHPYGVGPLLSRAIARARGAAHERARTAVAEEVTRLIARSGLTTAQLASRIGTSRSRLSTYRTGSVAPSATLLYRLRETVSRLTEGTD